MNSLVTFEKEGNFITPSFSEADNRSLFNAVVKPDHKIAECVNMTISVIGFYIEKVEIIVKDEDGNIVVNESTGEATVKELPRIVLIDNNGESYVATSVGVYNALKKAVAIFGMPDTEHPINIKPIYITRPKNNVLSFVVV